MNTDWWFTGCGAVMSILALIGPRFGVKTYNVGGPSSRVSRPFTAWSRVLIFFLGLALVVLGLYRNSN